MFNELDISMMQNALALAWQGRFSTSPNPRVGCVIARGSQIVGQGFHLQAGGPHAEVHALHQAGALAEGATAYVTLEPCSHYGRTPPCAKGLIEAGVARVVAAMTDPNPLVAGKGLAMLREAGIDVSDGLLQTEARALNRGFAREESVQVVVRPEDIEVVSPVEGQLVGVVNDVIFKGVHFEMHVECEGREWLIHSTRACTPGETIGMRIGPNEIHIMSRSEG